MSKVMSKECGPSEINQQYLWQNPCLTTHEDTMYALVLWWHYKSSIVKCGLNWIISFVGAMYTEDWTHRAVSQKVWRFEVLIAPEVTSDILQIAELIDKQIKKWEMVEKIFCKDLCYSLWQILYESSNFLYAAAYTFQSHNRRSFKWSFKLQQWSGKLLFWMTSNFEVFFLGRCERGSKDVMLELLGRYKENWQESEMLGVKYISCCWNSIS